MVTSIVLINADRMRITETAQELVEIDGIAEVYSVSGEFDIIAVVRVQEYEQLATLVTEKLSKMPNITGTRTHMAFRTYSKHDLDHIFDIGGNE